MLDPIRLGWRRVVFARALPRHHNLDRDGASHPVAAWSRAVVDELPLPDRAGHCGGAAAPTAAPPGQGSQRCGSRAPGAHEDLARPRLRCRLPRTTSKSLRNWVWTGQAVTEVEAESPTGLRCAVERELRNIDQEVADPGGLQRVLEEMVDLAVVLACCGEPASIGACTARKLTSLRRSARPRPARSTPGGVAVSARLPPSPPRRTWHC
jgi:hypothetical protein